MPETLSSGARWAGLFHVASQGMTLVTTPVLARLLAPDEFGTVAIVVSLVTMATFLVTGGVGQVLVTRLADNPRENALAHAFSIAVSWTVFGVFTAVVAVPTPIPDDLTWPLLIGSASLVPIGFQVVPRAVLQRGRRYSTIYRAALVQSVVYSAGQLLLGLAGLGVFAIIAPLTISAMASSLLLNRSAVVRPLWRLDRTVLMSLLRDAGTVTLGRGGASWSKQADNLVVAGLLGATTLGFYSLAFTVPNVLRQRVTVAATEIALPSMARTNQDCHLFSIFFWRNMSLHLTIGALVCSGLALTADWAVLVLFGSDYSAVAPILRWICLYTFLDFAVQPVTTALLAIGSYRRFALWGVTRFCTVVGGAAVGAVVGRTGVAAAVGLSVGSALSAAVGAVSMRGLCASPRGQYESVLAPPLIITGAGLLLVPSAVSDMGMLAKGSVQISVLLVGCVALAIIGHGRKWSVVLDLRQILTRK